MQHGLVLRAASRPGGLIAIQLAGVVDAHTLDRFESALDKALEHGARSLLLDCAELRYMSSSGFGELIRYHDRLRERGGSMVLARVAPKVAVILEMLGLKSLIPVVDSLEEGLRAAQGRAPAPVDPPVARPAAPPPHAGDAAAENGARAEEPVPAEAGPEISCPFCDAVLRGPGAGVHLCAGCGAPFALSEAGEVRWEWAPEDPARVETIHLTLDARPRSIAALTIAIEALLGDRGVAHVRLRRFAREAGQACRLLAEHAYGAWSHEQQHPRRAGPLHVLLLAGDDRLVVRAVERGRALDREAASVFATQADHLAQFAYRVLGDGVHAIEFVLLFHEAEVEAR